MSRRKPDRKEPETGASSGIGRRTRRIEQSAALLGQRIGDFELLALLGTGGFCSVFRARHCWLGTDVALKLLLANKDTSLIDQLWAEGRTLTRLRHHGIPAFGLVGRSPSLSDGTLWPWLSMELIDGVTAARLLHQVGASLSLAPALRIAASLLEVLAFCHDNGVVHGDVKPGNTMVGRDGIVRLIDFGLARRVGDPWPDEYSPAGTASYMAPEQWYGGGGPQTGSDVWAAALTLLCLLRGSAPAVDRQRPARLVSDLPVPVGQMVVRMLARRPSDRPTAREAAAGFREWLSLLVGPPASLGTMLERGDGGPVSSGSCVGVKIDASDAAQVAG